MIGLRVRKRNLAMGTKMWGAFKNEAKTFGGKSYFLLMKKADQKQFIIQGFKEWKPAIKGMADLASKGYVGCVMLTWKWGKKMIYYVKRWSIPKMIKDKAEKKKWIKAKKFKKAKRFAQMVLGQYLMEVKGAVVLPVFDPNTIGI
jgi:hypothetical protein